MCQSISASILPAAVVFCIVICSFVLIDWQLLGPASSEIIRGKTTEWTPWAPPTNLVLPWSLMPAPNHTAASAMVAYVIMASLATRNLHLWQRRTWLKDAKHVWAFSDYDDGVFTTTLPSLKGRGTASDAQHRQLRGMQWLRLPAEVKWIFMIDDDTWVNVPVLHRLLLWLPSDVMMLCGYRFHHDDGRNMFNGGGGMLLSRSLFDVMVPRLYSEQCPFLGVNDDTITECARKVPNATLMHSTAFSYYPPKISHPNHFVEQITVHPVKDLKLMRAMTATVNAFYS